jgi:2-polyprenyl-6-methoxyphenol hydroxylase-like FAD-dependent oxidoreductase
LKVLIIGGGIAGLTVAIALENKGIEVIICEQNNEIEPIGAGITLWPNALLALRYINPQIEDQIKESGFMYLSGVISKENGTILFQQNFQDIFTKIGTTAVCIHRSNLINNLKNQLTSTKLLLGKECVGYKVYDDFIEGFFSDGSKISADLIIGADGINSKIREKIKNSVKKRYSGYYAWRGLAQVNKEFIELVKTNIGEYWGKGVRFGFLPISEDSIYWFATENGSKEANKPENSKKHLEKLFENWTFPIPDLVKHTSQDTILYHPIYDIKPFRGWSDQRVILIGDAAHPTTPNLGQGGCIAIEDGYILAELISEISHHNDLSKKSAPVINDILMHFENIRFKRVKKIQTESYRIGKLGQKSNRFVINVRNVVVKILPPKMMLKRLLPIFKFEMIEKSENIK